MEDDRYPYAAITLEEAEKLANGGFVIIADGDSKIVQLVEKK